MVGFNIISSCVYELNIIKEKRRNRPCLHWPLKAVLFNRRQRHITKKDITFIILLKTEVKLRVMDGSDMFMKDYFNHVTRGIRQEVALWVKLLITSQTIVLVMVSFV